MFAAVYALTEEWPTFVMATGELRSSDSPLASAASTRGLVPVEVSAALTTFLCQDLIRATFDLLTSHRFDPKDAECCAVRYNCPQLL